MDYTKAHRIMIYSLDNISINNDGETDMTLKKMYSHVRKICLKRMIWPLFPIVVSVAMLLLIPFEMMIKPVKVTSVQQAIDAVEKGCEYIELTIPRLVYSGYNYMKDSDVYGCYFYELVENEGCVFFLMEPMDEDAYQSVIYDVRVKVKVIETNGIFDNMLEMFSSVIDWTPEGVTGITKPYVLSEINYHYNTYIIISVLVVASFIYGAVLFIYNLVFVIAPWLCPKVLYPKAQYEGNLFRFDDFMERVVTEMNDAKINEGGMYITEHFFVNVSSFDFCIVPIDKIKFAYEHSTLKSFLGMHLDVTYTLHLKCSNLVRYHVTKKTLEEANTILEYFKENNPEILIGYTNENKELARTLIRRSTGWFKR